MKKTDKKSSKMKVDLFRFVTLRSPQLITKERRLLGFVEHPNHSDSQFLKKIKSETDPTVAKQKLQVVVSSFTPFQSVEEVKQFAGNLWEFSMWLGKNKNGLKDINDLKDRIQKSQGLSSSDLMTVWDNLFYDILTQKNPYVRQACLQLLVVNHFISHAADYMQDLVQLKRIANSKVVVPAAFSNKKVVAASINSGGVASRSKKSSESEVIENYSGQDHAIKLHSQYHEKIEANHEIKLLNKLKNEFLTLEDRYQEDYQAAYDKAIKKHSSETDKKVSAYLEKIGKTKEDFIDHENDYNDTIPEDVVPDFDFEYPLPLSKKYTSRKLTKESKEFIEQNRLYKSSTDSAINLINKELFTQQLIADQLVDDKPKNIAVKGVVLKTQNNYVPTYTINTRFITNAQGQKCVEVYLLFNTNYVNANFQSATFNIHIGQGSNFETHTVNAAEIVMQQHSQQKMIFALLKTICFAKGEFNDTLTYRVDGDFVLDNGQQFTLKTKLANIFRNHTGAAGTVVIPSDDSDITHYGVNKIGVADYRKVEQELCCYIPGEVSHIENIMAREYKEKATRQLTRSEESIETTTEHEIEEQTDTTTATRHEIATEISNVVNNDRSRSLGYNVGVSGSATTPAYSASFDAGVTGEFSFAQSTSDSNSIAKTYAEDVTRRALERVVHKTTVKRSSKILKEFEENNKHGYDNRDGNKHVTGVFRWIDKVYKNRLVNYGKRLVYEFMIPEPGKYYKELITLEVNDSGGSSTTGGSTGSGNTPPVAPTHPKDYGINGPSDITRTNYQTVAGHYGVNPVAPKSQTIPDVSNSKSESINNDPVTSGGNFNLPAFLNIPADYECYQIKSRISYRYRQRSNPRGYIRVSAGGQSWKHDHNNQWNMTTRTKNDSHTSPTFALTGNINATVSSLKVWEFTLILTAKCRLQESVFNTWRDDVFNDIMAAYQQQLDAFNIALDNYNASQTPPPTPTNSEEETRLQTNPAYNKQYILNEMKRLCIEMLFKPFDMKLGKSFYEDGECKVPNIKFSPELDQYASIVKFFEQALDWTILSHIFYPYYWANRCDWKELFQDQDATDHILQAFLQSGMARVFVPVRVGFEEAVTYFLETGEIWQGTGLVMDTDDELYLSIVDETTYVDGEVEEEWDTTVPTALTIVQEGSALLNDEGLPCCEEDGKNLIQPDKNILQLLEEKE